MHLTTKRSTLLLLIVALTFISGCDFKDIDKRLFVLAIGIDKTDNEENPYKITLSMAIPSDTTKGKELKYSNISTTSSSLAKALNTLKSEVDKDLDLGHVRIFIFDERLLPDELERVMDFLIRRRDFQMISWVAIGQPSAEAVLSLRPDYETALLNTVPNYFSDNGTESDVILSVYLFELRRELLEEGIDPNLPIIKADTENKKLIVNQSLITSQKKPTVYLSSDETRVFKLLHNRARKLEIVIQNEDYHFVMYANVAKTKYKIITKENEPPTIRMNINLRGFIEESIRELDNAKLKKYDEIVNKKIKEDTLALLKRFQKEEVDPLGFGLRYKATRLHTRDTYEEWRKLYPEVTFDIHVNTEIKSTGTIE